MPKNASLEMKAIIQCRYTEWKVRFDVVTPNFNVGSAVIRSVSYEKDVYFMFI